MPAEKIGPARCPLCRGTASVSLSKSQLCVMTMNCCQAQLFTRSDRSDSLVRELLLKKDDPLLVETPYGTVDITAPVTPPKSDEPAPRKRGWLSDLLD